MNIKEICYLGIKIIAAGVTAAAMFFGVSKLTKTNENQNCNSKTIENNNCNTTNNNQPVIPPPEDNTVLSGLRKTQDICSKSFAVIQSLTTVVESLNRIFSGDGYNGSINYFNNQPLCNNYYQPNPWGNGYNGYPQVVQVDNNTVWTRLSPYIVAAGPNPNGNGYNNYYKNNYTI